MKLLLLCLLALTLTAGLPTEEPNTKLTRGSCPPFWYSFNGRCYKYVATALSWADAELNCMSQGANLVSIHSQHENNFVYNLIQNFDTQIKDTWIGLHDVIKEGAWMWTDGSAVNFKAWRSTQPDNYYNEDCTAITTSKWNDWQCHVKAPSVCIARLNCC